MATDGTLIFDTKIEDAGFSKGLSNLSSLAVKGLTALGVAAVGASTAVIAVGSAYETSLAKASTLFGDVKVDTDNLTNSILKMSDASGVSATELNEGLYQAMSAGVEVTEDMTSATDFLQTAMKLSKGGFTTTATSVDLLSTAINAYGLETQDAQRLSDIFVTTQNLGKTTVDELAGSMGRVIPTASAYKVNIENLSSAYALMTASGIATTETTTYLKSMLNELGDAGSEVSKILKKETGKSFLELNREGKSLGDIMIILGDSVNNQSDAFAGLWSSQEAGTGALALLNQGSQKYNETLNQMANSTGATEKAYEKMQNTFEARSQRLEESFKNVGISVYEKFKKPLANAMGDALKEIDKLSSSLKKGSPLSKSIDTLAKGFGDLITIIIKTATKVLPTLIEAFSFVVSNCKLLVTGFVAIKGAMVAYNTVVKLTAISQGTMQASSLLMSTAMAVFTGETTLAQGAMTLLNSTILANPFALAIAGVTALTVAIGALCLTSETEVTKAQELAEALDKQGESQKKSHEEAQKSAEQSVKAIDQLSSYKDQLLAIVDADGKVTEGFEARAKFLVGELAEATGVDIQLIGDHVQGLGELGSAIDTTIEKMRALAILEAHEEEYNKAVANQEKNFKLLQEAKQDQIDMTKAYNETIAQAEREGNAERVEICLDEIAKLQENVDKAEKVYDDNLKTISNFKQAQTDIQNGIYDTTNEWIDKTSALHQKGNKNKAKALQKDISAQKEYIASIARVREENDSAYLKAEQERAENQLASKREELNKLSLTVSNGTRQYYDAMKALSDAGVQAFDEGGKLTKEAQNALAGALVAINEGSPKYAEAIRNLVNNGEIAFTANGNLTKATQTKLTEAFVTANNLAPIYAEALRGMASNGEAAFNADGSLTLASQKKLIDAYSTANKLAPEYIKALKNMAENGELVFDAHGNLTESAQQKVADATNGANQQAGTFTRALGTIAEAGKGKFSTTEFFNAGFNVVQGLADGANSNNSFVGKLASIASNALSMFKAKFDIHSPSKVMKWIGEMIVRGLTQGVDNNAQSFVDSMSSMSDDAISEIDNIDASLSAIDSLKSKSLGLNVNGGVLNNAVTNLFNIDYDKLGKSVANAIDEKVIGDQIININQPTETPDEVARAIRMQKLYGLAGT